MAGGRGRNPGTFLARLHVDVEPPLAPMTMPSSRRLLGMLALAAAVLAAPACASRTAGENGGETGPSDTRAALRVQNQSIYDTRVYLVQGSNRIRLGNASPNSTTTLQIAPSFLAGGTRQLRFLFDMIASPKPTVIEDVAVSPGDIVTVVLPP